MRTPSTVVAPLVLDYIEHVFYREGGLGKSRKTLLAMKLTLTQRKILLERMGNVDALYRQNKKARENYLRGKSKGART